MAIDVLPSLDSHLSHVLERICINLQISPEQHSHAEQSYSGVTTWLAAEGSAVSPYQPLLHPQGSLAADTTVKPISQNEFDLDIVCRLIVVGECSPEAVYELVWDRMWEHGTYRRIMERRGRCIRLNYAQSSQFHLDVVPAIADRGKGGSHILIPDLLDDGRWVWKTSNPKGFLAWFISRKAIFFEKYARAEIEPLRRPLPAEMKAVLTKVVQLLKRWRDVKWNNNQDLATPSIVLTYLAADYYNGEATLSAALTSVLAGIESFVNSGVREIINPANEIHPAEVISEKWLANRESYDAFASAIPDFRAEWGEIIDSKRGVRLHEALTSLFGETATRAIKEASEAITVARANGSLLASKERGMLLTSAPGAAVSAASVKPNTHFGD